MPLLSLSERPSIGEIAGALSGLVAANRAIVADGRWRPRPADLRSLPYRTDPPGLDTWTVGPRLVRRGFGDCEDLMAAWVVALEAERQEVSAWLTHGGGPRQYHCFVRAGREVFDPSVFGGMPRPPNEIYTDPRAVRIA